MGKMSYKVSIDYKGWMPGLSSARMRQQKFKMAAAAGEIEARMTEARMRMTDEQRAEIPPFVTKEVVRRDQFGALADSSYEAQKAEMERMRAEDAGQQQGARRWSIAFALANRQDSTTTYTDSHGRKRTLHVVEGNRRYGWRKIAYKHCVDFGTAKTGGFTLDELRRYEQSILKDGAKTFDKATGRRTFTWRSPEGVTFTIGTYIEGKGKSAREVVNTVYTNRSYKQTKMLGTHSSGQVPRGQPSTENIVPQRPAPVKRNSISITGPDGRMGFGGESYVVAAIATEEAKNLRLNGANSAEIAERTGLAVDMADGKWKPVWEIGPQQGARRWSIQLSAEGVSHDEAKSRLDALQGGTFENRETKIRARLSSTGAGKLISNPAVRKSMANGFTAPQHNEMAANIDRLFTDAVLAESRPDKNKDPNIKSIKRFVAPMALGNEENAAAWITVKESTEHGHRIYSVEEIKMAALSPTVRRVLANRNSADSAASDTSTLPQRPAPVKRNSISITGPDGRMGFGGESYVVAAIATDILVGKKRPYIEYERLKRILAPKLEADVASLVAEARSAVRGDAAAIAGELLKAGRPGDAVNAIAAEAEAARMGDALYDAAMGGTRATVRQRLDLMSARRGMTAEQRKAAREITDRIMLLISSGSQMRARLQDQYKREFRDALSDAAQANGMTARAPGGCRVR